LPQILNSLVIKYKKSKKVEKGIQKYKLAVKENKTEAQMHKENSILLFKENQSLY
jgi:hypothetical protein